MNRAPLDAAFGLTLMVAGAMIALPESLKAKSPSRADIVASATLPAEALHRCADAKAAAIEALQKSDVAGYQRWEEQSRMSCQAAGF
jgi:hypothetical protein